MAVREERSSNPVISQLMLFHSYCLFDDGLSWQIVLTVFPKVHSMWLLQHDSEFTAVNVADNWKSFENLRGRLFGPGEELTWLEQIS